MEQWKCKECETLNDESTDICTVCGCKKGTWSDPKPNQEPKPIPNPMPRPDPEPNPNPPVEPIMNSLKDYENEKSICKYIIIGSTILQLIMYALPYVYNYQNYTIYQNCTGIHGSIEQICSILLVLITVMPVVVLFIKLGVRRINLPIVFFAITASFVTIYSAVIWFGNPTSTVVPAIIILCVWCSFGGAVFYVKTLNKIENAMYRSDLKFY